MKVGPFSSGHFHSRSQTEASSSLRAGQIVRLVVEGRRGDALSVRIGTRVVRARVQGDVRPGGAYRAEVVSTGRTLVLRTLERPTEPLDAAALARAHSLPAGTDSEAVVRAFVRSGLPLQAERLALALRRIRSSQRLSVAERARLAAVLEDKGLLDAQEAWDRAVVGAGGGSADEKRDGARGDDAPSGGRDDQQGRDTPAEQADDPSDGSSDAADLVIGVDDLREAFRAGGEADDVLQLVNHRRGREDAWILVPIEFRGDVDLHASVRLRLRHPSAVNAPGEPPRFLEAVLDVRSEGRRWTFAIRPSGDSLRVNALASPEVAADSPSGGTGGGPPWDELAERLRQIGIDFDHTLMSKDSNDGFSTEESVAIIQSIDSRA